MEMREFSWLRKAKTSPVKKGGGIEPTIEVVSSLRRLGMSRSVLARWP
jgi:hypothetical protein